MTEVSSFQKSEEVYNLIDQITNNPLQPGASVQGMHTFR